MSKTRITLQEIDVQIAQFNDRYKMEPCKLVRSGAYGYTYVQMRVSEGGAIMSVASGTKRDCWDAITASSFDRAMIRMVTRLYDYHHAPINGLRYSPFVYASLEAYVTLVLESVR